MAARYGRQARSYYAGQALGSAMRYASGYGSRNTTKTSSGKKKNNGGRKYGSKAPTKTKTNRGLSQDMKSIKNQLHKLKLSEDASLGRMTHRVLKGDQLNVLVNVQNMSIAEGNTKSQIEATLAYLRYYNPSTPGTLTIADATTGTFSKKVLFESITSKVEVRNNFLVDVDLDIYLCKPKDDTSQSVINAWTSGCADQAYTEAGAAMIITQLGSYPSDFNMVKALWSLKRVASKELRAGSTCTHSHTENDIVYDPSVVDVHSLDYQKEYKAFQWLFVIKGTASHDNTGTVIGLGKAGIDIITTNVSKVKYDAGINLSFIVVDDSNLGALTASVQSQKPVSDNQGYSLA